MTYALEYSEDGRSWRSVQEKHYCWDAPAGSPLRQRPVTRSRLQDIQREAEFHSYRYNWVRIVHPKDLSAPVMRDNPAQ